MNAHNTDILSLFLQAPLVVQLTMVILLLASIWCWSIILGKSAQINLAKSRARKFERALSEADTLDDLFMQINNKARDPYAAVFCAAMTEWQKTSETQNYNTDVTVTRLERVMHASQSRSLSKLEQSLSTLASIGSVAPFAGLFATVWGIMITFQTLGKSTSLDVIAPQISEALLATAVGLIAAMPAVMAYNKFSNRIDDFSNHLQAFSDDLLAVLLRQVNG